MDMDSAFWDESWRDDPDHVEVPDLVVRAETAGLQPGRALDLGCGAGTNALALAERGWSVTGIDFSAEAIRLAAEAAEARGVTARFLVADVTEWKDPEPYDLVITTYALPAGEDAERAIVNAREALAAGGTLLVAEWDISMQEEWGFEEGDFLPLSRMVELLDGLEIEMAEVRRVTDPFDDPDDPRYAAGREANIAVLRARRTV